MRKPMRKISIRLPDEQANRLETRANDQDMWLSELVRRYIDTGDARDTRQEDLARAAARQTGQEGPR
jgi:predicted DNA-binding protein